MKFLFVRFMRFWWGSAVALVVIYSVTRVLGYQCRYLSMYVWKATLTASRIFQGPNLTKANHGLSSNLRSRL